MKTPLSTITLLLGLSLTGCDYEAYRAEQEAKKIEREKTEHARIEQKYQNADGLASVNIPMIEIEAKKSSFTIDLWEHAKNEMKAQQIQFPVSEEYFASVSVGDELASKGNVAGFIFRGELSSYDVRINRKYRSTVNCVVQGNNCDESNDFGKLRQIESERGEMTTITPYLKLRESNDDVTRLFTDSCTVEVESRKSNFTLDIGRHIENSFNEMQFPLELPRFICEELVEGQPIQRKGVAGSLFLSSSPSSVTYTASKIEKNY